MSQNIQIDKAPFKVGNTVYHTWFKVVGSLNESVTPVVVLHGGPGMTHHYMLPHEELFKRSGIPVVLYDQIGNGESSHIRDAPDGFWTLELFMDELDNLLGHLGISDNFNLLGHSWGGMLAAQYASARTPKGLKRLIISNAPSSIHEFCLGTNALLDKFPTEFVSRLRELEREEQTNTEEYQQGVTKFYAKHVCTTDPWPQGLVDSFNAVGSNPTVYHTMFGASEFNVSGTLKDWSIVDILHQISCDTLLISSPLDEVQEGAYLPFFKNISRVKWVEISTSTHLPVYEDPERYVNLSLVDVHCKHDIEGGTVY